MSKDTANKPILLDIETLEADRIQLFCQPPRTRDLIREAELWIEEPDRDLNIACVAIAAAAMTATEWDDLKAPAWCQTLADAMTLVKEGKIGQTLETIAEVSCHSHVQS